MNMSNPIRLKAENSQSNFFVYQNQYGVASALRGLETNLLPTLLIRTDANNEPDRLSRMHA